MTLADVEVGAVMGRGDLQHARAEFLLDGRVADDRDLGAREGAPDMLADEVLVALVVGVDRHGGIAGDGLRTRGRDHEELTVAPVDRVAKVPHLPLLRDVLDLVVADGGLEHAVPVHEPRAAVDEPLLPEVDEGRAHGEGHVLVHGELGPGPVARAAEALELAQDHVPVLFLPVPDAPQELLPAEVIAGLALLGVDPLLDHGLRRDPGVVGARHPTSIFT